MSLDNLIHYNSKTETNSSVNWRFLGKNDKVIFDQKRAYACFSPITYQAVPADVIKIIVYRGLGLIPYSKKIIVLWIKELNKLGFPCSVSFEKSTVNFTLELKNFEFKAHLTITLQLIRALFEDHICYIPEVYFDLLESGAEKDKFFALQLAHKIVTNRKNLSIMGGFPNQNHMVTYDNNFTKPLGQEVFWERIKESKNLVYSEKYSNINKIWSN